MFRTQNMLHLIAAMAVGSLLVSPVFAQQESTVQFNATVIELKGEVLVNQGEKYIPAQEDMRVKNGDRIMVMKGGSARIKYDNSCTDTAETFSIYEVNLAAACALVKELKEPHLAQASSASPDLLSNPGVVGSLVVLGIVLLDDDDDKRRSVSP